MARPDLYSGQAHQNLSLYNVTDWRPFGIAFLCILIVVSTITFLADPCALLVIVSKDVYISRFPCPYHTFTLDWRYEKKSSAWQRIPIMPALTKKTNGTLSIADPFIFEVAISACFFLLPIFFGFLLYFSCFYNKFVLCNTG